LNLVRGGGDEFRGSLQAARKAGATVTKEQAEQAAKVNDAFQRVETSVQSVLRTIVTKFSPQVIKVMNRISELLVENKGYFVDVAKVIKDVVVTSIDLLATAVIGLIALIEKIPGLDLQGIDALVAKRGEIEAELRKQFRISDATPMEAMGREQAIMFAGEAAKPMLAALEALNRDIAAAQEATLSERLRRLKDSFAEEAKAVTDAIRAGGEKINKAKETIASNGQVWTDVNNTFVPPTDEQTDKALNNIKKIKKQSEGLFNLNWDAVKGGYNEGLKGLELQVKNFSNTVGGMLASGVETTINNLANAFAGIIDGTKSAKEAFKDFGRATLQVIGQIIAKMLALQVAKMVIGMDKGGVLPGVEHGNSSLPVKSYAQGGVATSPQLALFGEGNRNEAFVPLPDNRSIPVTFTGGGYSQAQQVNLNVYAWDSKDAARGLIENRDVLQSIFTHQADHQVNMRQTLQRATR